MLTSLIPASIVAAGILGGTFASRALGESGAMALVGPALLALSFVLAGLVARRSGRGPRSPVVPFVLAGIVLLVGAGVVLGDPSQGPAVIPLLGACALPLVAGRRSCCEDAPSPV